MTEFFNKITGWFIDLVIDLFGAIWDFFGDLFIDLADVVLTAVADAISSIPAPDFLSSNNLGSLINMMDADILFFVGILQIPTGLGLLASGFAVRMLRKIFTLFQW